MMAEVRTAHKPADFISGMTLGSFPELTAGWHTVT
jgi:hypothetical protein